ncbi:flagellin N-terminal helical domain-containing protein [Teichococcus vastitatis]|uniref:flagellin N-terminal helical domain-containing protein n=1 Tax=Teichococcus vastitatis TaxID=2307076 RepID=UPI002368ABFC|nr:flagellin [Pseudoroseomonas vastitatis]
MVSSILTNNGAMTALQSLKSTQKSLLETQNRISTGLKVSTAKDNAATWAVATSMRSDIANYKQVSENLSVSASIMSTAANGAEQIASLVSDIRIQVTSVQDGVKDAKTVQANIDQLIAQIDGIVGSSSFKGVNLLDGSTEKTEILASVNANGGAQKAAYITADGYKLSTADDGMLAELKKVSVENRDAVYSYAEPTGAVATGDQLSFTFKAGGETKKATFSAAAGATAADMMKGLKDAINTAAGDQIAKIDVNGALVVNSTLSDSNITFDGETALAKSVGGSSIVLGTPEDLNPSKAKFSYSPVLNDELDPAGAQTFEFSFKVDGTAKVASVTTVAGDDFASMLGKLRDQINLEAGTGNEIASIDTVSGKLVVDAAKAGGKVEFDGENALKSAKLEEAGTLANGVAKVSFNDSTTGLNDAQDSLTFDFAFNGVAKHVTAYYDTDLPTTMAKLAEEINDSVGSSVAYIDNAGKMVIDRNAAKGTMTFANDAFKAHDGGGAASPITAVPVAVTEADKAVVYALPSDSTRLTKLSLTFTDHGGTSRTATVTATAGESNKSVLQRMADEINDQQDTTAYPAGQNFDIAFVNENGDLVIDRFRDTAAATPVTTFAASDLKVTSTVNYGDNTELSANSGDYSDLLASLKKVESNVLAAGAAFGAVQTRVDMQKEFMDKLVDTLTSGVGALVDADMSEEAARLQALQVQEQLGTQALSIANQAPQSILSLFRG